MLGDNAVRVEMDASVLLGGINRAVFATADDELRPVMNGIYFDITTEDITMVASDGHKLVRCKTLAAKGNERAAFILPKKPASLIKNLLPKEQGQVVIEFDERNAVFTLEKYRIGCTGTTFTDPCGLDPGNVTTARDAYLLVRVAMGYDAFAQAAGEESYQMPASTKHDSPYTILTSDKLVSPSSNYYRSYTKGGKTGSLDDWQNFAGWHTQDGETYVSVVLHSPKTDEDPRPALTETAELMDWAFATFTVTAALDTTQPITELPIVYSSQTDTVMIYPADDMQTLLPRQGGAELTEKTFNVPEHLSAPIKQGDVVGTVTVTMQGETVGTVDLLAGSSVDRNELLYTMAKVKAFFSSTYFKVVIVLCIIAAVVYAVLWVYVMLLTVRRVEQPTPKRKNKPND